MNYLDLLNRLQLKSGEHWRGDCPECGGSNTFSVTNDYGTLRYFCFRASCHLRGNKHGTMSCDDIVATIQGLDRDQSDNSRRTFAIPEHFVRANERPEVIQYLRDNYCLEAYYDRRVDIRYDPRQNRAVFLIKEDGECYGAVGRALDRSVKPKWFRYDTGSASAIVQRSIQYNMETNSGLSCLVLVEDFASCCACSSVTDSMALLGTNLSECHFGAICKYPIIAIALDKDASDKSFDMQRELSFFHDDVRIVLLEQDLKYLSPKEIKKVFYEAGIR